MPKLKRQLRNRQNDKPAKVTLATKNILNKYNNRAKGVTPHETRKDVKSQTNRAGSISSRNPTRQDTFERFSSMSAGEMLAVDRRLNARKKLPHAKGKKR